MTSPCEQITVKCPKVYQDWQRASFNLDLDDFNDKYMDEATSSTCPDCKHKVRHEALVVRTKDGAWEFDMSGARGGDVKYWTQYWKNSTCEMMKPHEGQPLDHAASNEYSRRGVAAGDWLYVVTVVKGDLHLIGRMKVDRVASQAEAARILGTTDIWEASGYCLSTSSEASPMRFDVMVSRGDRDLPRFFTRSGLSSLKVDEEGRLDQQTLRSIRELTEESARLLDKYIEVD